MTDVRHSLNYVNKVQRDIKTDVNHSLNYANMLKKYNITFKIIGPLHWQTISVSFAVYGCNSASTLADNQC